MKVKDLIKALEGLEDKELKLWSDEEGNCQYSQMYFAMLDKHTMAIAPMGAPEL